MMISREVAEVMAKWWGEKVSGKIVHDNGDKSFHSSFAGALADSMATQITDEAKKIFIDALIEEIVSGEKFVNCIGCDYHPDKILADAAIKAGINEFNFPWKTYMYIGHDPCGNIIVTVREGYGSPPEDIYPV